MSKVDETLENLLSKALASRKKAAAAYSEANEDVEKLRAAINGVKRLPKSALAPALLRTQKPKRKKRGAIKTGVLDAIRKGPKTRADIIAALQDQDIPTTPASVSNALSRLQDQKLIESCPTVKNGWQIVGSSPANRADQNEESPIELQSEGLSQKTGAESKACKSNSVPGGLDKSGNAFVWSAYYDLE